MDLSNNNAYLKPAVKENREYEEERREGEGERGRVKRQKH